ncbi:conserved hypothetical protein [Coxiella burnetii RSA 331]|nr:conserved hypothetical protein [Coxiella burnetii RSA 331]EDR36733.1 conserved hypothetical protein [Coxiella burnetii Q321]
MKDADVIDVRHEVSFIYTWLGCQDSNLGMLGSKPSALPLGDTPRD